MYAVRCEPAPPRSGYGPAGTKRRILSTRSAGAFWSAPWGERQRPPHQIRGNSDAPFIPAAPRTCSAVRFPDTQRRYADAGRFAANILILRSNMAWLGREDSNLRMAESKSAALPLGDAPSGAVIGPAPPPVKPALGAGARPAVTDGGNGPAHSGAAIPPPNAAAA